MVKDDTYYFHQTPPELCKELIKLVPLVPDDIVLEPFKGEGGFYDNLPDFVKPKSCEIEEGRDYKDFNEYVDWVITNPPFQLENETIKKRENTFFKLLKYYTGKAGKGIAFLGNDTCFGTLTPKRLKELSADGWYIHNIVVCSVKKWRGRYFFIIFKKEYSDFYKFVDGNF